MRIPIPILLIGAGQQGARAYASYALRRPEDMQVVALVEPDEERCHRVAASHKIPHKRRFYRWQDLLTAPQLADIAIVTTPDHIRVPIIQSLLEIGYHVMVETPMTLNPIDCLRLLGIAHHARGKLLLSHPLRHTAFYRALHDIVHSGRLGNVISYKHERLIPFWRTGHQFVRNPNWQWDDNPMMMLEGIHEFDLMQWIIDDRVERISSVGSLRDFVPDNAPMENLPPLHCVDDCPIEAECPFSAIGTYVERRFQNMPQKGFPHSAVAEGDESQSAMVQAVEESVWGDCVYHANTSLIDNQSVMLKTSKGINASLTLKGHSIRDQRLISIDGSKGSVQAEFIGVDSHLTFYDYATKQENTIQFRIGDNGHGGEHGSMGNLVRMMRGEVEPLTLIEDVIGAHLLAFAAEEARISEQVINFNDFQQQLQESL